MGSPLPAGRRAGHGRQRAARGEPGGRARGDGGQRLDDPRVAITDAKGEATATWTLGTILGPNEVTASVTGVDDQVKFQATGTSGSGDHDLDHAAESASSRRRRFDADHRAESGRVRQPDLAGADVHRARSVADQRRRERRRSRAASRRAHVRRRDGRREDRQRPRDRARDRAIAVHWRGAPVDLAVGQVVTDVSGAGFCVHASSAGHRVRDHSVLQLRRAERDDHGRRARAGTRVAHRADRQLVPSRRADRQRARVRACLTPDLAFEQRLRKRERAKANGDGASCIAAARPALERTATAPRRAASTVPAIGDLMKLNVNTADTATNPDYRTGRVVAITDKAIVVADTANPAGGFTDAEYPVDRRHVRYARRSGRPRGVRRAVRHRQQRPRDHLLHARRERADDARDRRRCARLLLQPRPASEGQRTDAALSRQQRSRGDVSARAGHRRRRQRQSPNEVAGASRSRTARWRTSIST